MRFKLIRSIARKELTLFFASAVGVVFLGAYLAATLFVFFWVETFFARNIADVRPMFEWLPVLLIFLSAALTMRMWSEERRTGTLEFVTTLPVSTWEFVCGKFLACWVLLGFALLLTLPLTLSVAAIGDLDWGPVIAGYIAALMLGAAYISIGLFVSSRTDSQIVSLIGACLICGLFYLLGAPSIVELFGGGVREFFASVGSGSRFESITRGMLDVRDLYFYASISVAFLALNVYGLERGRWSKQGDARRHQVWRLGTVLLVTNLLIANVWINSVTALRFDMTQGRIYSISDATHGYLEQLKEPLLITGYFSQKTHPLLAPLVPRLKDLLEEYEVAGAGRVRVEIIDPVSDPEAENEANTKFGIQAVPFQVQDRHQASLVNSYLDIVIQYGDEYEVLGFRDLIEVKVRGEGDLDVQLKNPEFDITRAVKKVLYGFQGGSSVFANITDPVRFVGYVSSNEILPEPLIELGATLNQVLAEIAIEGGDKFSYEFVDPAQGDGDTGQRIADEYGFQPMSASLFEATTFYFYLTLQNTETVVQIAIPDALSKEAVKKSIGDGLKRFAAGLLRTVVFSAPAPTPPYMQQQGAPRSNEFNQLQSMLTSDFDLASDDLTSGVVPDPADLVMVMDPTDFDEKQVFALDQYLMKGGTVVVASGAYAAQFSQGGLTAMPRQSGLEGWLRHHGIEVGASLVMDSQNAAFPVPVTREVGGFSFQDLVMLDYPYFVDIRDTGIDVDAPMMAGLNQLTMSWPSPLLVNTEEGIERTDLLHSTENSWLSKSTDVSPQVDENGLTGFAAEGDTSRQLLAVALKGKFDSYFANKPSPLLLEEEGQAVGDEATNNGLGAVSGVINHSPESARLIVFGSNDFVADQVLQMVGSAEGTVYGNTVQLLTNVVDWAVEDQSLISIRGRGNFNRTLPGMEPGSQSLFEYLNYLFAFIGTGLVMLFFRSRQARRSALQRTWVQLADGESV